MKRTFGLITTVQKDIFRSNYHRGILAGIFQTAGSLGHSLKLLIYRPGKYRSLGELLNQYPGVDGFFMIAWRWLDPGLLRLVRRARGSEPLILLNDNEPGLKASILYTEVKKGMESAVDYLVRKGRRHLAAVLGPRQIGKIPFRDVLDKQRGFEDAVRRNRLPLKKSWVRHGSAYCFEEGLRIGGEILSVSRKPEAIVCGNDDLALGILEACRRKGIRVPQDLAVTGFDNTERSALSLPPLTTVAQPLYEMGRDSVRFLIRKLQGSPKAAKKKYPTRLVIRKSA